VVVEGGSRGCESDRREELGCGASVAGAAALLRVSALAGTALLHISGEGLLALQAKARSCRGQDLAAAQEGDGGRQCGAWRARRPGPGRTWS
jgi:hypothetical protein